MGRAPCCDKTAVKRGFWTTEEDRILVDFIHRNGHGNWRTLPKQAGLLRCGKSCRLRWINYLCPNIRRGNFSVEEEEAIIKLHQVFGNRWSAIASRLPGRTDNEIKNVWNTHLKKSHLRTRIEMPSTTKDSPADDLGIKFSCQKKVSTESPTTISNLSESHKPLDENFPCVSNMDSESMTEDSASTSEWPQSNCLNSLVGCDQDPSTIGHNTNLEDLLKDERIILENQNFEDERNILENQKFEDEERWFYMQGENAITWEQNSNLNAHYFMSSYPEDDILSSTDCEGALLKGMFEGGDDDDYWLNVLSQVGQSTLLSFAS